jgi:excisionase family DNA binding protein
LHIPALLQMTPGGEHSTSITPLQGAEEAKIMVLETRERGALRPNEAAQWLGVSRDTVERLIQRGELRRIKVGAVVLITVEELRRYLRGREEAAQEA